MKTISLLLLSIALLGAAEKGAEKAPEKKGPVTVPADATEIAPRVWRHKDASGKTWIYRQTPFGLSKVEEINAPASASAAPPVAVKVTDLGDSVRFEKPNAMGSTVWERKKTELGPEEKEWIAQSKSSTPAAKK